MLILAQIPLPQTILDIFIITSVLLAIVGTLFLAYDLLGRENGLLRWFTLVIICGLISALIIGTIATIVRRIVNNAIDLNLTLQFMAVGGLMGFYTVILIELPPSKSRPPIFSRKGSLLGLAFGITFAFIIRFFSGELEAALSIGVPCAIIASVWQRITWETSQAVYNPRGIWQFVAWEEPSPSNPNPRGSWKFVDWEPPHPKPRLFSRKRFLLGLGSGYLCWFIVSFVASKDVTVALLESIPFALVCGFISGTWWFINWEPPHPRPQLFSRKGFWNGFVAGFVPWLIFMVAENAFLHQYSGPGASFEAMLTLSLFILVAGALGLATATAGSIAQYTLWKANRLPYRILGTFGLVLIMVAFILQGVQPVIDLFNK
ncbi:MAG: hypothetical protein ACXWPS_00675 [Ktedonobacteraceae bacterium]